jgi:tetratricopeptide (TPR) repeat protein
MNSAFIDRLNPSLLRPKVAIKILSKIVILTLVLAGSGCAKSYKTEAIIKDESLNYQKLGRDAQLGNDLNDALSYYKKATYLDPYNAEIYNDLATIYERQENYILAVSNYKKAIEIDKNFLAPYFNLGRLYEKIGKRDEALFYYKQRVELAQEEDDPWVWKAKQRIEHYGSIDSER